MSALKTFVGEWNIRESTKIELIGRYPERPTGIEVRYSAAKHCDHSEKDFAELRDVALAKSHGTLFLSTDYSLFANGIISFYVASANHNYREEYIISALKWLGETLLPRIAR